AVEELTVASETLAPGSAASVRKETSASGARLGVGIPRGEQGVRGPRGERGETGPAGVSPAVSITQDADGATVTVTDGNGTTSARIRDGRVVADRFYRAFVTDTGSGSVVSFDDGADDVPLKALSASVGCTQALNGYDHPWPGCGGKNLLDYTAAAPSGASLTLLASQHGFRVTSDGEAGTHKAVIAGIPVKSGVTYTLSADILVHSGTAFIGISQASTGDAEMNSVSHSENDHEFDGVTAAFVCTADGTVDVSFSVSDSYADFKSIQLEAGSAATAWEPFSNVCPITGQSGVSLRRTNGNLLDCTAMTPNTGTSVTPVSGGIRVVQSAAATYSFAQSPVFDMKAGHTYRLSCTGTAAAAIPSGWKIGIVNSSGSAFLAVSASSVVTDTPTSVSVRHTPAGDTRAMVRLFAKGGGEAGSGADVTFTDIMLSVDDTEAEYVPYQGDSFSVSFGSAGNVFGGTLDVTAGLLTVTKVCKTLTGSESFQLSTSNYRRFISRITNMDWPEYKNGTTALSSHFKDGKNVSAWQQLPWGRFIISNDDYLVFLDNGGVMADTAALSAWLAAQYAAGTPVQVAYELETPQTVQLTPTEVKTLLGENRLWASGGNVAVEYRADPKKYIDARLAALQALVLENGG
ncbi:MAG: collagen-like protein, partial [Oscillospiraceae bacterium]|nr:collagen-like protein [Oscillospiraceae bacterium]